MGRGVGSTRALFPAGARALGYIAPMLLLLACAPESADPGLADDNDDTAAEVSEGEPPADLAEPTGDCPDFDEPGKVTFTSGGLERKAYVYFPEERPAQMPVIFAWHPLGANAKQMVGWLDLDTFAEANGAIVVVPDSDSSMAFEWGFVGDATIDLAFYDDLRTCVVEGLGADVRRVSSTGMSAGALWTTYLGIHRGDTLAAIAPWSGGTGDLVAYDTPAYPFPALLVYGGEDDTYNAGGYVIHFDELTRTFADQLTGDGHQVTLCAHDDGHYFPPDPDATLTDFLMVQRYGSASPISADTLPDLSMDCALVTEPVGD